MQLFMGDEGEQTKGLSQVQDQIGCEENEKGLNEYSGGAGMRPDHFFFFLIILVLIASPAGLLEKPRA